MLQTQLCCVGTAHPVQKHYLLRREVIARVGLFARDRPIVLVFKIVSILRLLDVDAAKVLINLILIQISLRSFDGCQHIQLADIHLELYWVIELDELGSRVVEVDVVLGHGILY